jgi:hypothetical protein
MSIALAVPAIREIRTSHLLWGVLAAVLINTWILQEVVMTREVYHTLMSERLESYRIDEMYIILKRLSVWNYVLMPLVTLVRLALVALILQLPLVLKFIDIPFDRIFRVALLGFTAMLALSLTHTGVLIHSLSDGPDREVFEILPLSLATLADTAAMPKPFAGFLNSLNLFELAWCALVSWGLTLETRLSRSDAAVLTGVIWVSIVMFEFIVTSYLNKVAV